MCPDTNNDWINQRDLHYQSFFPLWTKHGAKFFNTSSLGAITSRDEWAYNFNPTSLLKNMRHMIEVYNDDLKRWQQDDNKFKIDSFMTFDPTKISWSYLLQSNFKRSKALRVKKTNIRSSLYRPFCKKYLYYVDDNTLIERAGKTSKNYPTPETRNLSILTSGKGAKSFSVFITDLSPDRNALTPLHYFSRYTFQPLDQGCVKSTQSVRKKSQGKPHFIKPNEQKNSNDSNLKPSKQPGSSHAANTDQISTLNNSIHISKDKTKKLKVQSKGNVIDLQQIKAQKSKALSLKSSHATNEFYIQPPEVKGYKAVDNIVPEVVQKFQKHYNDASINGDAIFYYIYGLLHSKSFVKKYNNDLLKQLPRLPMLKNFMAFARAGKKLADLHLNYETEKFCPSLKISQPPANKHNKHTFRVNKMKHPKTNGQADRGIIVYNEYITVENIPLKAYEYEINGFSAIKWVMTRYLYKKHKTSQLIDDPNRPDEPQYILNLLRRVINVALKSVDIINQLPEPEYNDQPSESESESEPEPEPEPESESKLQHNDKFKSTDPSKAS